MWLSLSVVQPRAHDHYAEEEACNFTPSGDGQNNPPVLSLELARETRLVVVSSPARTGRRTIASYIEHCCTGSQSAPVVRRLQQATCNFAGYTAALVKRVDVMSVL